MLPPYGDEGLEHVGGRADDHAQLWTPLDRP